MLRFTFYTSSTGGTEEMVSKQYCTQVGSRKQSALDDVVTGYVYALRGLKGCRWTWCLLTTFQPAVQYR